MAKSEIELLREKAKILQQTATGKINRNRRNKGVELARTVYDPRVSNDKIQRYNRKQLDNLINKVSAFNSRRTQFAAGVENQPLSMDRFREYKRLEKINNSRVLAHDADVLDIQLDVRAPLKGMKIRERRVTLSSDKVTAFGEAVQRPLAIVERNASAINGRLGLESLIKDMKRKSSVKYLPKALADGRKQLDQMLKQIGASDLRKAAKELDDYQFSVMWLDTSFANDISTVYEIYALKATTKKERFYDSVSEDSTRDATLAIQWAAGLKKPDNKTNRKNGK